MCRPASFVIADNGKRAFWSPTTDSHEEIIKEHGLVERVASKICIVRVEIVPPGGGMTKPLRQWIYNKDQDFLPEWYNAKAAEKLCRIELKKWFAVKVFVKGVHEVKKGSFFAVGNSQVTAWGNSQVTARENSQVTAWENSQVTAWGNSQVTARENSQVTAWGNSQVTAWENSQVTAWENSQVTAWGNSQVTARENSQVTALENSQVTAWGNSQVTARENSQVTAWGNSQVTAWENSQVTAWGNSTTNQRSSKAKVTVHENAVAIDRTVDKPVIHTV